MDRQPISREGYEKIREEIRVLEKVDMPAVAERIKTAREEGDLKENAEYHAARESQGYMQAKINQLKTKLSHTKAAKWRLVSIAREMAVTSSSRPACT